MYDSLINVDRSGTETTGLAQTWQGTTTPRFAAMLEQRLAARPTD